MAASNIPTGSTTRVRRTPFAVSDPVSKKSSLIFESVDNDRHLNDKNYGSLGIAAKWRKILRSPNLNKQPRSQRWIFQLSDCWTSPSSEC
jgi:hypothetical protein